MRDLCDDMYLVISIHALLAESDHAPNHNPCLHSNFYPRSPCGERLSALWMALSRLLFLSTLSLRRATLRPTGNQPITPNFYPRSPCGERLEKIRKLKSFVYFYPRSPCGERPLGVLGGRLWHGISIHALLAESDILKSMSVMVISISIHALLAESDKVVIPGPPIMIPISIHALLAESDWGPRWIKCHLPRFLSTLSLRRATADVVSV